MRTNSTLHVDGINFNDKYYVALPNKLQNRGMRKTIRSRRLLLARLIFVWCDSNPTGGFKSLSSSEHRPRLSSRSSTYVRTIRNILLFYSHIKLFEGNKCSFVHPPHVTPQARRSSYESTYVTSFQEDHTLRNKDCRSRLYISTITKMSQYTNTIFWLM